jgi:ABC-type transport system involved in cytochrome bd biosynthesis fused ATPase/permease subunit
MTELQTPWLQRMKHKFKKKLNDNNKKYKDYRYDWLRGQIDLTIQIMQY